MSGRFAAAYRSAAVRRREWRLMAGLVLALIPGLAHAHEPLWGEAPTTLPYGIVHPVVKVKMMMADELFSGSSSTRNPKSRRMEHLAIETKVVYGLNERLNLALELPYVRTAVSRRAGGRRLTTFGEGPGDLTLLAKYRTSLKVASGSSEKQAVLFGIKLPTGERVGALGPHESPGSGKFGYVAGYIWNLEHVQDTWWASAIYRQDLGPGYRRGGHLMVDTSYGYWVKRANQQSEVGVLLLVGPHLEVSGGDHRRAGRDPNSGGEMLAIQSGIVVTRGNHQFRAGALVPFYRRVNGRQLGADFQLAIGIETFF